MEEFMELMVRKKEFRELLEDPFSENSNNPFFYNAQVSIGRWLAPWTSNRALLVRADPGTGKTRMALAFISTWMQYSDHRKALILADGNTILKAFSDEIVIFKEYDKVLDKKTWIVGKKSHGKSIATTRLVKSGGIEQSTLSFIDHIAKEIGISHNHIKDIYIKYESLSRMTLEEAEDDEEISLIYDAYIQLRDEIRRRYSKYSIVVDEVHLLRKSQSVDKQSYGKLLLFLDAIRDVCPILFATATPIIDNWRDLMSVLAMLHSLEDRIEMDKDIDRVTKDSDIEDIVKKWAKGIVSDRSSAGIVPTKMTIPGYDKRFVLQSEGEEPLQLSENIYPVFMSQYQTLFTSSYEDKGSKPDSLSGDTATEIVSEKGVYSWRKYYDFVPPVIEVNGVLTTMSMESLVQKTNGRYEPTGTSYLNGGKEPVFDIEWIDQVPSTERGLGKYSAKFTELIRMMKYDEAVQDKCVYVHTPWVEYGTKPLAAALSANGWEQYTGVGEVTSGTKPKFAVIHGAGVSSTKINNIIAAFNSPNNRDGSILRMIVGSKKSGISISFINTRVFLELASSFNKAVRIQSEGRVFRASSLTWLPRSERFIYSADIVAFPSLQLGSEGEALDKYRDEIGRGIVGEEYYYSIEDSGNSIPVTPYTIEMKLNFLAQEKFDTSQLAMNALKEVSIEAEYERYLDLPVDTTTYDIIYSNSQVQETKEKIKDAISRKWNLSLESATMLDMKAIASLISNKELVVSNYGIPSPVQDVGDYVSSYRGKKAGNPLSLIYSQNFFITEDQRSYNNRTVALAISTIAKSPTDEYEFFHQISSSTPSSVRVFLIEMSLARDPSLVSDTNAKILDSRRNLILSMYKDAWDSFNPSTLVHILWYLIRSSSYVSKLGITSDPEGKSRILPYQKDIKTASTRWRYERIPDTESIYLSSIARKIYELEMGVINRSMKEGFYVHFSLADGIIRIRHINLGDLRKSKFFSVDQLEVSDFISNLLDGIIPEDTSSLNKAVYYAAKEKNILVIR
jgi:hypothetical protein